MKRIFVGVEISAEARRKVSAYIDALRNQFRDRRVGWEKAEKLHLTLKFLGDSRAEQLGELETIVAQVARQTASSELQLSETGVFTNAKSARVLWIDVKDGAGKLGKMSDGLEAECEKIGFAGEKRKFVPHLTIGRIRDPHRARE